MAESMRWEERYETEYCQAKTKKRKTKIKTGKGFWVDENWKFDSNGVFI
jgi:hypothetical protein